jgi:hypothetical protein
MGVQPISVSPSLAHVLNVAGERSGVDFDYLLQTAIRESSLNPKAKAQTSSATGLFQFIESTWLEVMKSDGPRLGYQQYADAIGVDGDGDYVVKDKALRQEILALREDPQVAADLAAAFTRNNGAYLHERFGRMPSPGELYIAHFLGAKGAEKMFTAGLADPDQIAAKLFPKQAKANRAIFYSDGQPRTIREVYRALVAKHDGTRTSVDSNFAAQQIASSTANGSLSKWPQAQPVPSRFGPADMSFTALFSTDGELVARPLIPPAGLSPGPEFELPPNPLLDAPEPAADQLSAYSGTVTTRDSFAPASPSGMITPRVLMTDRRETPAVQVVTNLYGR